MMPDPADPFARLVERPHRRHDPLRDEWVLVSAGRTRRPWQGHEEAIPPDQRVSYDPGCYLCPGNQRADGSTNPTYDSTLVFTNDFPALEPEAPEVRLVDGLFRAESVAGTCRVVCFSPRHDASLGIMAPSEVRAVVEVLADQTELLGTLYRWVQAFENRGQLMGASSPHPHGQIWATTALPTIAGREDAAQLAYLARHGTRLLLDLVDREAGGPRVVVEDEAWLVVVPFWASWPFETLLVARQPNGRLTELDGPQRDAMAGMLVRLVGAYDRLFGVSFPYSMGWHQAPFPTATGGLDDIGHWQLHGHVYPPLLGETIRKFMVGYELLAEVQRDLTPEWAAERLRAVLARDGG
jgi:UDPglucose--hexose-1-phosphate uridylyltransferase